jgi:predicted nuclease of predicted toxin-antitoxin system
VRWLLDSNVPRGVTHLLRDQGEDVVEVRVVLAANAPDADVLAYASATATVLVTHDSALARRARALGHPFRCAAIPRPTAGPDHG